jgi:hypothetical protein
MATESPYTPEYYNQLEQYYNTYTPAQAPVDRGMLEGWYNTSFTPEASISLPSAASTSQGSSAGAAAGLLGAASDGGGIGDAVTSVTDLNDVINQLQALQNPVVQAAFGALPFGLGGALGGYLGSQAANQLNDIVGLYGGTLGQQVNPLSSTVMGLFGFTPDTVQSAQSLAGQFGNTSTMAGYMQAATDPVLGGIVNSLANQAPNGLTAEQYGTIAQSIGQQINETIAANPGLSYQSAAALTASNLGIDPGYGVGTTYGPDNVDVGGGWSPGGDTSYGSQGETSPGGSSFGSDLGTSDSYGW